MERKKRISWTWPALDLVLLGLAVTFALRGDWLVFTALLLALLTSIIGILDEVAAARRWNTLVRENEIHRAAEAFRKTHRSNRSDHH